jgi:hypothetical protein
MTYNRPGSEIYVTADKLSKLFERKFAKVPNIMPSHIVTRSLSYPFMCIQ